MLADILRIRRKVEDDFRPFQCQTGTRRNRSPYILTNLDTETYVRRIEQDVRGQRDDLPAKAHGRVFGKGGGRSKPPLLIKLLIIGQIGLWNNSQYLPLLDNGRTIHQYRPRHDGQSQNRDDVKLACIVHDLHQRELSLLKQQRLREQVTARVSRQIQLRENNDLHSLPVGYYNLILRLPCIELAVSHLYRRNG